MTKISIATSSGTSPGAPVSYSVGANQLHGGVPPSSAFVFHSAGNSTW